MSKRLTDREQLLLKLDQFADHEITELLDHARLIETKQQGQPNHDRSQTTSRPEATPQATEDELVSTLSCAYENCRARQVFEWESIRRSAESRASARHYV
jgi:hypothetical protein